MAVDKMSVDEMTCCRFDLFAKKPLLCFDEFEEASVFPKLFRQNASPLNFPTFC
jgi:hypothetical protein